MRGKTHLTIGLATGILFIDSSLTTYPIMIGSLLGCVLPDIDIYPSTINKLIPFKWAGKILNNLQKIQKENNEFRKHKHYGIQHRHFCHSIFFPLITFALYYMKIFPDILLANLFFGLALGNISHLIADMITGYVYLFSPFDNKWGLTFFGRFFKGHPKGKVFVDRLFMWGSIFFTSTIIAMALIKT